MNLRTSKPLRSRRQSNAKLKQTTCYSRIFFLEKYVINIDLTQHGPTERVTNHVAGKRDVIRPVKTISSSDVTSAAICLVPCKYCSHIGTMARQ